MIDLKKMQDMFGDKVYGQYNTYPQIVKKSPERLALHVAEEAGEIARAIRKSDYKVPGDDAPLKKALEIELADQIILSTLLADSLGINIDETVRMKLHLNFLEAKVLLDVDTIIGDEEWMDCNHHQEQYYHGFLYCCTCGANFKELYEEIDIK